MAYVRIGIVGSGMIAEVIANAIKAAEGAELVAVASRRVESAQEFAAEQGIPQVFASWQEMVASGAIDAVYVATPTAVKEEILLGAAEQNKHLLGDKPFASFDSLKRITDAAKRNGVAFMDATHFVHNPRTSQIKTTTEAEIGTPQALRSSFFVPFMDRSNIRFNPDKEPIGAVGDMAWYSMRAITEFLRPQAELVSVSGGIVRDQETGAVIRGAGVMVFADGKSSTFDFGYDAGVCLMDLDILGQSGQFHLDDFVLDWKHGFTFDNPDHVIGYTKRSGMQAPSEFEYVAADSDKPQAVLMIENFAKLVAEPGGEAAAASIAISEQTQYLLDRYWAAVRE